MSKDELVSFHLGLPVHGWVEIFLQTPSASWMNSISYTPNDGLRDFLTAVNEVLPYSGSLARCLWSEEPGFYLVEMRHEAPNITLLIRYTPRYTSHYTTDKTDAPLMFQGYCPAQTFAQMVHVAYRELHDSLGEKEYYARWLCRFPQSEWERLQVFLTSSRGKKSL